MSFSSFLTAKPCIVVSVQEKTSFMGKAVVSACCWHRAAAFLSATWLLGWALAGPSGQLGCRDAPGQARELKPSQGFCKALITPRGAGQWERGEGALSQHTHGFYRSFVSAGSFSLTHPSLTPCTHLLQGCLAAQIN